MKPAKLVLLFLAFVLASPAGAIFSENFDGATPGYDNTLGAITGTYFSLTAGSIDVNGPAKGSSPEWYQELCAPTSGNCIDTVGGSNALPDTIKTASEITFNAAGWYVLSFDLEGWYESYDTSEWATVQVDLGSLIEDDQITVYGTSNPYLPDAILFQVTTPGTSAYLTFSTVNSNSTYAGGILDNVSIDPADPAPEPRSVLLFGLGALILVARKRVRQ
jgi:hypothetical protein